MRSLLLCLALSALAGVSMAGMMGGGMMGSPASPPGPPAKDADPQLRQGFQLVESYCVQCHQAPNPVQHTAADWPAVINRMQHYMQQQHRHLPSAADRKLILHYLTAAK